jgi:hypothetical protein
MTGTCDGYPSSAVSLRHAVEEAVAAAAPDAAEVAIEGPANAQVAATGAQRIALLVLHC